MTALKIYDMHIAQK